MKPFGIAVILLFLSVLTYGQENLLVWNESKPLQWDDFSGKANDTSHFDAESFAEVLYKYTFNSPKNVHFEVKATFNRNISWIKQGYKSAALLKHEQAHFDIAELYSRKLKMNFDNFNYSSDFEQEVQQIFNKVKAEYHQMQRLYDEQTNHSTIVSKQNEWETLINEELAKLPGNNSSGWKETFFANNR